MGKKKGKGTKEKNKPQQQSSQPQQLPQQQLNQQQPLPSHSRQSLHPPQPEQQLQQQTNGQKQKPPSQPQPPQQAEQHPRQQAKQLPSHSPLLPQQAEQHQQTNQQQGQLQQQQLGQQHPLQRQPPKQAKQQRQQLPSHPPLLPQQAEQHQQTKRQQGQPQQQQLGQQQLLSHSPLLPQQAEQHQQTNQQQGQLQQQQLGQQQPSQRQPPQQAKQQPWQLAKQQRQQQLPSHPPLLKQQAKQHQQTNRQQGHPQQQIGHQHQPLQPQQAEHQLQQHTNRQKQKPPSQPQPPQQAEQQPWQQAKQQQQPLQPQKAEHQLQQQSSRLSKSEEQRIDGVIVTKGAKESSDINYSLKIPQRKNLEKGGTEGRNTEVETNYFSLDMSRAKPLIVHYDVAIRPDKPKRLFRAIMESFRREYYPKQHPAFDGKKNLYSCGYLPFNQSIVGSIVVNDDEHSKPKEYDVEIQFAKTLNLKAITEYVNSGTTINTPRDVMQAVDVILREASVRSFIQVGRLFFSPEANLERGNLGDGLILHSGFFQSASFGWKPFVNIDVAHKGFAKVQKVHYLMAEMANCDHRQLTALDERVKKNVGEYLTTLKVDYELPNQPGSKRCMRVNGLVGSACDMTFQLDNGNSISVLEYFKQEKHVQLQYPDLPCLHVGPPNRKIYVPAELCTVRSQLVMRLTDRQASQIPRLAATSTDVRKYKIQASLEQAGFRNSPTLQEFGFSVNNQFEKVNAQVLAAPHLEYKDEMHIKPEFGKWRASQFFAGSQLKNWIVLNIAGSRSVPESKLRYFVDLLLKAAHNVGMMISPPFPSYTIDCPQVNKVTEMEKFLKKESTKNLELVVVVIPDKPDLYPQVKQFAELKVGVLTQCIKANTFYKSLNIATVSNILLKLNAKRNGINHSLLSGTIPSCLEKAVMLVGADVTHPPPRVNDYPSIAAVCASYDHKVFCYNIQYRFQGPRQEIIVDLENIMGEHLNFFKDQRNSLPEKIIFYRDGVGEGQFLQVLSHELRAIQSACRKISTNYEPKITFLVVQKRHHTRFFPLKKLDTEGRNNNVLPGTVVDTKITHPTETDFYLVSHASIQGVSRPTRYHKLWDDSDMSDSDLEILTYYLCHMFSRCTRSVSYPAPTYYAHLAAYRVRAYIKGQRIQINNLAAEQNRRKILDDISKKLPMFFV